MLNWLAHYFLPTKEVLELHAGAIRKELASLWTRHESNGGYLLTEQWARHHALSAELGEVETRLAQMATAQPAQAGADRAE